MTSFSDLYARADALCRRHGRKHDNYADLIEDAALLAASERHPDAYAFLRAWIGIGRELGGTEMRPARMSFVRAWVGRMRLAPLSVCEKDLAIVGACGDWHLAGRKVRAMQRERTAMMSDMPDLVA